MAPALYQVIRIVIKGKQTLQSVKQVNAEELDEEPNKYDIFHRVAIVHCQPYCFILQILLNNLIVDH